MNYIIQALLELAPGAQWNLQGDTLVWVSKDINQPTEEQINLKISELEAAEPMRLLRLERNKILKTSDWRVVKAIETGIPMSSEWKTYRQSLRDITKSYSSLDTVLWPTEPT